jgi:hypothetical protein
MIVKNTKLYLHYIDNAAKAQDDFLSFLKALLQETSQKGYCFDVNKFEASMFTFLGDVSMEDEPMRAITSEHLELLKSIRDQLSDRTFKRAFSNWILNLDYHVQKSSSMMSRAPSLSSSTTTREGTNHQFHSRFI